MLAGVVVLALSGVASAQGPQGLLHPEPRPAAIARAVSTASGATGSVADAGASGRAMAQMQAVPGPLRGVLRPQMPPTLRPQMPAPPPPPGEPHPMARPAYLPRTQFSLHPGGVLWTRAAMSAVSAQGRDLTRLEPRDIAHWCPAYSQNGPERRAAFWVGFMSALARYESTWRPTAVGGGGLWYGLLQILPDTARRYGCRARSGSALLTPWENLSCAARIMAVTVRRDRAIAINDGRWRGVAADWGPMQNPQMTSQMAAWTRAQPFCKPEPGLPSSIRPVPRPTQGVLAQAAGAMPG
ncbi:transglycosylase SLT domain-containing protein [Limimaricola sp.]|uniref:transglycosylase SLT domain-containing protein n=1 Tax=Limimaricola sp. TaxID=2211665 RepID=UPI0025BE9DBB|nr:transglycosylase SLT domain-containing protein [Limimaricola sp.]